MKPRRLIACVFFFVMLLQEVANAKNWEIQNQQEADIVWSDIQDGDTVFILAGEYHGPWHIGKSVTVQAQAGAVLIGNKQDHGVRISAPHVSLSGLRIENWGDDLGKLHSGVFVDKQAENVVLENLSLQGTAFGIWIDAAKSAVIRGCKVQGDLETRSQDRGNGIHLFNVSDALIEGNEVWHTRDGIYIDTSNQNQLVGNYLHDLRYGIHYMYSHSNLLKHNLTERTRTGYALMQSHHLDVQHNTSQNDLNYGILMNFITYSTLKHNKVIGVKQGRNPNTNFEVGEEISGADGKALFVYNSVFNEISENEFMQSDLAVHLTAGSDNNKIYRNAFVGNRNQVKYVSTRPQEWSYEGQGNYWSDYLGWDMNKDGLGDTRYEPNDGVDKLLWKFPSARVLFNSPGVLLLRWVEQQFPVLKKPGVTDSYPLIALPVRDESSAVNSSIVQLRGENAHGS